MANGGRIDYTVGFKVDQSGLNQIKANLASIQQGSTKDFIGLKGLQDADQKLIEIKKTASDVEVALNRSFNSNLGTLNISKFNQELKKLDIKRVYTDFAQLGPVGQNAFRNITSQILTTNLQLKQTNKWLDEMATTMANSVKWGITSSIWNNMTGAVEKAWSFTKKLDTSLNDIRIVTQKSADDMERYAVAANKAAKNLGQTTTQYTNASLIYYQQGLSDAEVQARTETTLKAANVTGQSAADVSEQLTAVWNGYKVSAEEAELYVDKLSAVAATTAADLEELSTGMSKVASAASLMGVDIDQLNAQLATVVSVTRQAPESVGTAFKTIYARMGDIEAGLDTETSLGEYTKKMNEMGFNVLDTNGKLRDMGSVIDEIGNKWTDLSREQQVALSQIMAGTRQYNNLLALFDNWDMYSKSIETSKNATGALQRQQDIYMESMEAHLQQLQTAGEGVYNALFNAEDVNPIIDALTGVVSLFKNFVDAAGGAQGMLLLIGNTAVSVFSKQIASGLATTIANFKTAKENANQLQAEMEILSKYENANINDSRTQDLINMKRQILDYDKVITEEERNQANEIIKQTNELYKQQDALQNKKLQIQSIYEQMTGEVLNIGTLDASLSEEQIGNFSQKIADEIDIINGKIEGAKKEISNFKNAIKEMNQAEADYNKNTSDTTTQEKYSQAIEKVNTAMGIQKNAVQDLLIEDTLSLNQREKLSAALEKYRNISQQVANGQAEHKDKIAAAIELQKIYNDVLKENKAALNQAKNSLAGIKTEQDNLNNSLTTGQQVWKQYLNQIDLKAKAQQVINFANSLGRISMTLSSLGRIDDIFKDVNLSAGEKLLQIMSALSMTIPGVVAIASAIGKITGATGLLQAKLAFMVITQEKEAAARAKNTIAKKLENDATKQTLRLLKTEDWARKEKIGVLSKEVALEKAEELITKAKIPADSLEAELIRQEIRLRHANAAAIEKENVFKALQEKLTWANIKAKLVELKTKAKDLWSSFKGLTGGAKIVAGAIGAIAIVAAGTALTLNLVNKGFKDAEEAAKKSAESLNTLTESYNTAKTAFENFQKDISDYSEAKTALEEMTTGTEEWKNAVQDVNKQVIDLISNYKELAPYVQRDSEGNLSISNEGLKTAEQIEQEKLNNEYQQLMAARIYDTQTQSEYQRQETKEELENFGDFAAGATTVTIGAIGTAIGAAIGTAGGPLGMIIGAAIGTAVGGLVAAIGESTNIQESQIEEVTNAYSKYGEELFSSKSEFSSIMEKSSNLTQSEIDALWSNKDSLIELSRSVDANTQAQQAYMQQYVQSALEGNEIYESSENKEDLEKMVSSISNKNLDKFVDKWKDKLGGKTDEEIQKAYAKLMKWDTTSIDNQTGNKATYYFSDGTSKTIDDATARYALAMADASENAAKSLQDFQQTVESINKKLSDVGLENEILSTFFGGEIGDFSEYNLNDINLLENITFTDEEAINRGYENAEDLINKIQQAKEDYTKWFEETTNETKLFIGEDNFEKIKNNDILDFDELSLVANKNLSKALTDAFYYGGQDGLDALTKMLENVPAEKMEDFLKAIGNINFSDPEALDNLKDSLIDLGIELDDFSGFDQWENIIDSAIAHNADLATSLDNLISKFLTIDEQLNKMSFGDIIEEKDYQDLIAFNKELANYFQLLSNGKYRFIGWNEGGWDKLSGSNGAEEEAQEYLKLVEQAKKETDVQTQLQDINDVTSFTKYFTPNTDSSLSLIKEQLKSEIEVPQNLYYRAAKGTKEKLEKKVKDQIDKIFEDYQANLANPERRAEIVEEYEQFLEDNSKYFPEYTSSPEGYQNPKEDFLKRFGLSASGDNSFLGLQYNPENFLNMDNILLSKSTGFSSSSIQKDKEMIQGYVNTGTTLDHADEIEQIINKYGKAVDSFVQKNKKIQNLKTENKIIAQTKSFKELNSIFLQGIGSVDAYVKQYQYLSREMAISAGVEEEQIKLYKEKLLSIKGITDAMAEEASSRILLSQTGLNNLADNWEEQYEKIVSLDEFSPNYTKALDEIQTSLSQIFGAEKKFFDKEFIQNHKDEITKLLKGDKEAFDKVSDAVVDKMQTTVDGLGIYKDDFNILVNDLQDHLDGLSFGDQISNTFADEMAKILLKAGKTATEIMAIFSSMGISINEDWLAQQQIGAMLEEAKKDPSLYGEIIDTYGSEEQKRSKSYAENYGGNQLSDNYFKSTAESIYDNKKASNVGIFTGTEDIVSSLPEKDKEKTSSEPNKKDYLKEDRDRYHDINVEIKKLTNNLEDLKTAEEHLTGKDLINNLNQQLKILDKTVARQREKLKIQKQEQKELQAQLKSQGVKFNEDGTIANYNTRLNEKMQAVNKAIATYNSFQTKEEQEAYEETLEAIEKDYEEFKEKIERYEELVYDDMQDLEQEIADNISEQISLKIQAFDETVKIELDFTDAKKSWIEFKKELDLAESDIFGRSKFDIKSIKQLLEDIKTYQWSADTTIQDYKEGKAGSENSRFYVDGVFDKKAAMEALREEQENLQNALLAANQKINEVQRSYLDMLDQVQEKLDKQMAGYEHINELINHGLKLTELLSGEDSYKEKSTYYSKMATNYKDQIDMASQEKDLWDAEIARAQDAVANATTDQEREIAQEQLDKVVENWRNATNELNSLVEAAIENLQAQYENSIDQALQEMTEKFTNGKSLDYISKEWELINDNADRYLDTVNSTYEVQALEAKYMNAIDSTDSISAQKKLNKVMEEELAALREKDKLTQYDIDRANKKLDITMKQIALEEAQANKSTMRLRRDAQGNYSYQFVADEDEIAKAQQDLLAAQNDLYNFDKEAYEKNLDEAYQAYVQFQEDLKKAAMINDPEERAAYEALIREQYEQKITDLTAINETIRGNLQNSAFEALSGMYNTNEENFKLMNDDILADFSTLTIEDMPNLMGQLVEGWNTGIQQMITSFAGEGGFSAQCQTAYEAIKAAQDVYQNSLKDLEEASGKTFDNIESDIDKDIDKTNDFIKENDKLIDQIRNDLDKQWKLMTKTLAKLREEYEKLEKAAKAALDEMMRIQNYEHKKNTIIKDDDPTNDNPTSPNSPSNPKKESEEEEDNPKKGKGEVPSADIMKGVAACIWYGTGAGGWENNPGRKAKLTEKFTSEGQQRIQGLLNNKQTELLNWAKQKGGTNYNQWLADNYSYSKFDTGGYTGEWGAEGRMAMLHEKEIVLNKQDTANILSAVSIVRGIGDLINSLSANLLGSLSQKAIDSTLGMRDFEQNVHITAEFPNVSSSSEIEDALRNLTNVAAQRAFNTRI